jgi:molybdopterin-guanine dinucleotide biosynthesis protein A
MAGVVLCGGRSSRMGRDKATLPFGGHPLVVAVAEILRSVAEPVFLAPGTPGRLGHTGYREVADTVPDGGPLPGIVAALRASPHPLLAVVAVDMPFASPAVFRLLASSRRHEDALVPVTADGPQPLHAVYARGALPRLERALAEGDLSVQRAIRSLTTSLIGPDRWGPADPSGRFAVNLNRPEDLALLE